MKLKPKRIQRKRTKGFKLPVKTLCVSRPSIWRNPFPLTEFGELTLPLFRNTLLGIWNGALLDDKPPSLRSSAYDLHCEWQQQFSYRHPLDVLRSTLPNYDFIACWCKEDASCHADILLELGSLRYQVVEREMVGTESMKPKKKTGKNGDFTKPERNIREALFAVFYEKEWELTYRPPLSNEAVDVERWKFVDGVIDELRKQLEPPKKKTLNQLWMRRFRDASKEG